MRIEWKLEGLALKIAECEQRVQNRFMAFGSRPETEYSFGMYSVSPNMYKLSFPDEPVPHVPLDQWMGLVDGTLIYRGHKGAMIDGPALSVILHIFRADEPNECPTPTRYDPEPGDATQWWELPDEA